MSIASMQAHWQTFWWGTVDARLPAALRIGLALAAIWVHLSWWPEVDTLLSFDGQPRAVVAPALGRGFSVFCLSWASGTTAQWLHGLTLLPLVALLLGLGGRWMAVVAWLVVLGWYHRAAGTSSGGDRLLRFGLLYLSLGAPTARWSLDAWRRIRRGEPLPERTSALAIRLVQVQWAAMYAISGIEKARGVTWRHGTALHYALSNRSFSRFGDLQEAWMDLPGTTAILSAATVLVLFWELTFPLGVALRRTRWLALLSGILMHLGIGLTMSVGPFTLVSLVGYIAYLDRYEATDDATRSRIQTHRLQSKTSPREHIASTPSESPPEPT